MAKAAKLATSPRSEPRVNVRFTQARMDEIEAEAKRLGMTTPSLIRMAILNHLDRKR